MNHLVKPIRSFVRRERKLTQKPLFETLWPQYGLTKTSNIDLKACFTIKGPITLEIGFGTGSTLFQQASNHPDQCYIGIEVYRAGIATLLSRLSDAPLNNLRIFEGDAVEICVCCIPDESLDSIQILFPDPWPKRRHHKRRLIQPEFVDELRKKLKIGATLYLSTDWHHYATHMLNVLELAAGFKNQAGIQAFSPRAPFIPLTKFEKRGLELGHKIWHLCFTKCE